MRRISAKGFFVLLNVIGCVDAITIAFLKNSAKGSPSLSTTPDVRVEKWRSTVNIVNAL